MSENKTSKYLKYAVGEILLVVIGILIALQINNWNAFKKDRQTETIFLEGLINDINEQKLILEDQKNVETRRFGIAQRCLQIIQSDSMLLKIDSVFTLIRELNPRKTFSIFNPTYEELKSTGSLRLIKDESLKKAIILFYQNLERGNQIITSNNLNIDNIYKPFVDNNNLGFYRTVNGTLNIDWKNKRVQLLQLSNNLHSRGTYSRVNAELARKSIDELNQLKVMLNDYLINDK